MYIDEAILKENTALYSFLNADTEDDFKLFVNHFRDIVIFPVSGNYSYDEAKPMKVNIVDICALYGKTKHIEFISQYIDIFQLMQKAKYRAFRFAVANGHLNTFKQLCRYLPEGYTKHIRAHGYMIFRYASKKGDIPIMKHLIELAGENAPAMIGAQNNKALEMAHKQNNKAAVSLILTNPGSIKYALAHKEIYFEALQNVLINMKKK
jgi:ankyrin repeat protein